MKFHWNCGKTSRKYYGRKHTEKMFISVFIVIPSFSAERFLWKYGGIGRDWKVRKADYFMTFSYARPWLEVLCSSHHRLSIVSAVVLWTRKPSLLSSYTWNINHVQAGILTKYLIWDNPLHIPTPLRALLKQYECKAISSKAFHGNWEEKENWRKAAFHNSTFLKFI